MMTTPANDLDAAAAGMARVASLLGGPVREIRPHRAAPRRDQAPEPPRGGHRLMWIAVLVVAAVAVAGAAFYLIAGKAGVDLVLSSDNAEATAARTVSAPLNGRQAATFELGAVTDTVTLRGEDLGTELYRISTPAESDARPVPMQDGDTVRLSLTAAAGKPATVEVVLNVKVLWTLRLTGGAQEHRIDLSNGQVAGVDLAGSARTVELTLPTGKGTVPVEATGSIDQLVVRAPKDSPVRVTLDSGAQTVAAGEKTQRNVPPGSKFTPKGWETANRYDVTMSARATLVSVESR